MADELTREELLAALAFRTGRDMGSLLVAVIGLAAETHPDLLRTALSKVYDHTATEEACRRIEAIVRQAYKTAGEARDNYRQMATDAKKFERRIEALEHSLERLEQRKGGMLSAPCGADKGGL